MDARGGRWRHARRLYLLLLATIVLSTTMTMGIMTQEVRKEEENGDISVQASAQGVPMGTTKAPETVLDHASEHAAHDDVSTQDESVPSVHPPVEKPQDHSKATAPVHVMDDQHPDDGRSNQVDDPEDELERVTFPSVGSMEVEDSDENGGQRQNYASLDAGATILDSSSETKSPTNLLVPDKDRYMLTPCANPRKWVVVSLSEDVHADALVIANYEKYSSPMKDILVLGSVNFPTDTWFVLGNFTAAQTNGEQVFPLDSQHHVRYLKIRFLSHYGTEYYCTLSQLKVYGRTFTQVISQLEMSIDAETALDSTPVPPAISNQPQETNSTKAQTSSQDKVLEVDTCAANRSINPFYQHASSVYLTRQQQLTEQKERERRSGICLAEDQDKCIELQSLQRNKAEEEPHEPFVSFLPHDEKHSDVGDLTDKNATQMAPVPTAMAGLQGQGLGRLESIFVRITKKIQTLEANQSVFGRQLEHLQKEQTKSTQRLQEKHEALEVQLDEIRLLLSNLTFRMDKELTGNDELVQQVRRENIALWREMVIVREVMATLRSGILCAIALSAMIICAYLLRLLMKWLATSKERADLREWFWRVESLDYNTSENAGEHSLSKSKSNGDLQSACSDSIKDEVEETEVSEPTPMELLVDRKLQFGTSWDDSAISRKTMFRDLMLRRTCSPNAAWERKREEDPADPSFE